ncbi:MAG: glycerophosphodiester phosphodiesterase [Deltaproteobacteria bacterium]|jgi:glycerophosphoryl diester phosphodiesterase|nr:glycerophosphodiester phosphodiesterase [Deltaproteobacteria bacterium]MBW2518028.1 glycerophosphodiester phosphodiesterase [Deltaproteobacteria bacterium]
MFWARYRSTIERLRSDFKAAIAFEFWATLILTVSIVPASGWLLNRLVAASGQFAVSDNDLIAFFLSTPGILFLIFSVGFVLAFWFAEQVGLLIISIRASFTKKIAVSQVLWEQIAHFPALVRLGLLQATGFLVASIPFVLGIGLVYWLLLTEFDLYFYINVKPLSFWIALIIAGAISAIYFLLSGWLYVRWLFSIPILVFEDTSPIGALKKSWQQTRGRFWQLTLPLAIWWVVLLTSSFATTWLVRAAAAQLLDHTGLTLKTVLPIVLITLALMTFLDIVWLIIAKIVHVMLMADFYLENSDGEQKLKAPITETPKLSPRAIKRIGWGVAGVALIVGVGSGAAFLRGFNIERTVEITGHRGSKVRAPENTLSALQQAIAEGADFAEIDVQTTADGVVVLFHDADLMRVASLDRRLRDINYGELRDIDVGSWFAPQFSNERIPTLQQAIDLSRGRIKLNIELKFTWPDPVLTQKVADLIRQNNFSADCVVSSLNFQALTEIKQRSPELITGFIVFTVAGNLPRMKADFLSLNAKRATPRLVKQLHRHGRAVHVWTVNDFNNVISMVERGVDNVITDYPRGVRRFIEEWRALSDGERIVLMLRNLIVDIESPEPSDL